MKDATLYNERTFSPNKHGRPGPTEFYAMCPHCGKESEVDLWDRVRVEEPTQ